MQTLQLKLVPSSVPGQSQWVLEVPGWQGLRFPITSWTPNNADFQTEEIQKLNNYTNSLSNKNSATNWVNEYADNNPSFQANDITAESFYDGCYVDCQYMWINGQMAACTEGPEALEDKFDEDMANAIMDMAIA